MCAKLKILKMVAALDACVDEGVRAAVQNAASFEADAMMQ